MKQCTRCKASKPASEFGINKAKSDGLSIYCKKCLAEARIKNQTQRSQQRKQSDRKYRANNTEKIREYHLKWSAEHKGLEKKYYKRYRAKYPRYYHREKERGREKRRKNRKRFSHYSNADWQSLKEYFGGVCLGCGVREDVAADHVIPLMLGGLDHITNLQPLCKSCNSKKGGNKIIDYRDTKRLEQFLIQLSKTA